MRKRHIVRNVLLIVGGFILLLIILAQVFKNDIVKLAIAKGAKTFDVPLTVGDVDFSLLYRFPLATIEFNDLVMTGKLDKPDSLVSREDTIIRIGKLYASVDLWELMDGNILVKKIDIKDADVRYLVDSLGNSNLDFLLKVDSDSIDQEEKDTSVVQGVYSLDKLTLTDISIDYSDKYMKFDASLFIPEVKVNGSLTAAGYSAATSGEVQVRAVDYADFHLENLSKSRLEFDVTALNDTIDVSNIQLDAAGAIFNAKGIITQGDSIYTDLNIEGNSINLKETFNFLSQDIKDSTGLKQLEGVLNVKGNAKGYLTPNSIPMFNFTIDLSDGLAQYEDYPVIRNINLSTSLANGIENSLQAATVNVNKFHAETVKSKVDATAIIQNLEQMEYEVSSNINLDFSEFASYIPDSLGIDVKGSVLAKISTSGTMPDSITDDFTDYVLQRTSLYMNLSGIGIRMDSVPEIKSLYGTLNFNKGKFVVQGLKLKVPEYKVNLTNGYLNSSYKGRIADYKNLSLNIDSMLLALDQQTSVSLSGKINGLDDVKYQLKSNIQLALDELFPMVPDSMVNNMKGLVNASISSKGEFKMDSVMDKAMALMFENSDFKLKVNNVTVDMPDTLMNVSSLNGLVTYKNDSVFLNSVSGSYAGLDFSADSTYISKVYTAAVLNQPKEMRIHGNFSAGDLDYAFLEKFLDDTDTIPLPEEEVQAQIAAKESGEAYEMKFTYKVNGKAKLKSFKYGDILVENIDTKFLADIDKGNYVAKDLTCNVFGGEIQGAVKYRMSTSLRDTMNFKMSAVKVDVAQMIDGLKEYVADYDISKENVKGELSSNMDGQIVMQDFEPVYDAMMLKGNLTLEDGALINVKPVMEVEKIPMIGISGLEKLYFSTLKSNIFLFRNKLYIPRTEIRTSSFDAMFLGMYSFGDDYAYHIRMFLGEILASKSKRNLEKQTKEEEFDKEEESDITKGRTSLYVVSKSENGKEKAGFDKPKDRRNMAAKVNLQKNMVDMRFHPVLIKYIVEE